MELVHFELRPPTHSFLISSKNLINSSWMISWVRMYQKLNNKRLDMGWFVGIDIIVLPSGRQG